MSTTRDDEDIDGSYESPERESPQDRRVALLFRFLSDPKRLIILRRLMKEKGVFPEILADDLNIGRSTSYAYIKELIDLGIVTREAMGNRQVAYVLSPGTRLGKRFIFENISIELE